ncbi:MAG: hypothetical protein KGH60_04655 [Candidatus Micrarchaeota archaeon]|nr:hypothetical protein [Candidatus Micrarchaeota archaeon]
MQTAPFSDGDRRSTGPISGSTALRAFRREFADAVRLFNEALGENRFQNASQARNAIQDSMSMIIELAKSESSCIDLDTLWYGVIMAPFMPVMQDRFKFTDLEWHNLGATALDMCIRGSVECHNPENSEALADCADRLLESNRHQTKRCSWTAARKTSTAGRY